MDEPPVNKLLKRDGEVVPKKESGAKDSSDKIAEHYNTRHQPTLASRWDQKNIYQKNFNNWIKSVLIGTTLARLHKEKGWEYKVEVMDMCSGKGGDLLKWKFGRIHKLTLIDIAEVSVEQSKERYTHLVQKEAGNKRPRQGQANRRGLFSAEFITADCTKTLVRDLFEEKSQYFDIASLQFSFHYCFESLSKARVMIQNVADSLKKGGYFIGTTIDSNAMVKRLRASQDMTFGNEIFKVKFELDDKDHIPLFNARYHFYLNDSVDCPEFLVHLPLMRKLASEYGLEFEYCKSFKDLYEEHKNNSQFRHLLKRSYALEELSKNKKPKWPADMYSHTRDCLDKGTLEHGPHFTVGGVSKQEWEIISLYQVFSFRKK